jgi:hypothetical protein
MPRQSVRLLAILQMVQGGLECFGGLLFALSPGGTHGGAALWVGLSLAGLGVVLVGLLRITAGILNMFYRGRGLGMTTLVIGLLSAVTCFCLPTSVALCAYGFVVYTNKDVRQAFALRANGASVHEINDTPR